jgi:hypothetical protein
MHVHGNTRRLCGAREGKDARTAQEKRPIAHHWLPREAENKRGRRLGI